MSPPGSGEDLDVFERVLRRMLEALPDEAVESKEGVLYPLRVLNRSARHDFLLTLLSGWAMVAEISSFYRDRIVEEGYLRTATEPLSIENLGRLLGYRGWQGSAAETWLALTVSATRLPQDNARPTTVNIPPGGNLVVQNIPAQGSLPMVFESHGAVECRADWNSLVPRVLHPTGIPIVFEGMIGLRLAGAVTSVRPGSPILIETAQRKYFRMLETVELHRADGFTVVTWDEPLDVPDRSETVLAVRSFRQHAGFFGRRAPSWQSAPDAVRALTGTRSGGVMTISCACGNNTASSGKPTSSSSQPSWTSIQADLPAGSTRALAVSADGRIFAATSEGLYAATKAIAPEWSLLRTTPAQQDVQSLFLDDRGFLYAGATRGAVSFSSDDGQSWQSLRGSMVNLGNPTASSAAKAPAAKKLPLWRRILIFLHILKPEPAATPAVLVAAETTPPNFDGVVHALSAGSSGSQRWLFAGTDRGVFRMQDGAIEWQTFNSAKLPGYNAETGLCGTVVNALCFGSDVLFAGTGEGLWSSTPNATAADWRPVQLSSASTPPAVFALAALNTKLFAGTAAGFFTSADGTRWTPVAGFPSASSVVALAAREVVVQPGPPKLCILAGTASGVYCSDDAGAAWTGLPQQEVPLFQIDDNFSEQLQQKVIPGLLRQLFSANGEPLPDDAVVIPVTDGSVWQIADYLLHRNNDLIVVNRLMQLTGLDLHAVALGPDGTGFFAATTGSFLQKEWPGFQLSGNSAALDRSLGDLPQGTEVVFHQEAPEALDLVAEVAFVEQRSLQAWGSQGVVTILTLTESPASLGLFRQRDATLWCKPVPLAPYIPADSPFQRLTRRSVDVEGVVEGLRDGLPIAVTGLSPTAVVPSAGGVFQLRSDASSGGIASESFGLEQENLLALISDDDFYWAIVEGAGIRRRSAKSPPPSGIPEGWNPVSGDRAPTAPRCLASSTDGLWVGDGDGVVQWAGDKTGWTPDPGSPSEVTLLIADSAGNLFAATEPGQIARRSRDSRTWEQLCKAGQFSEIKAFVFDDSGALVVGAAEGVFRLDAAANTASRNFVPVPPSAPAPSSSAPNPPATDAPEVLNVTALAFAHGSLFAGTATGGLFRLPGDGFEWQKLPRNRLRSPIQALVFTPSGDLLIATGGEGIWRLSPSKGAWEALFPSASNDIVALVAGDAGTFTAAAGNGTVFFTDGGERKSATRTPTFTASAEYAGILDLEVVPAELSTLFQQNGITLDRPVVVVARRGSLWILRSDGEAWILYLRDPGLAAAALCVVQATTFEAHTSDTKSVEPALCHWCLDDGTDRGTLVVPKGDILLGPSIAGSTQRAEVTTLAGVDLNPEDNSTRLTFQPPLRNLYDSSSTTLTANLAWATQGATVALEVLGDGNTTIPGQSFILRQPPVTRARRHPDSILAPALEVHVNSSSSPNGPPLTPINPMPIRLEPNGEIWKEVNTLFGAGPRDRVYTLRSDPQGKETIHFGDGVQGARLPTGLGNVSATYRTGLGTQGNLPAGSLIVFRKRPVGIRSVSNPVPATGGIGAETIEESRTRMNLSLRALDRIVSREDYVDFCVARADVVKAHLTWLPDNQKLFLSIVPVGNPPPQPSDDLIHALRDAIAKSRADQTNVEIGGFRERFFRVGGTLFVDPDCDAEAAVEAVRTALLDSFSVRRRDLAQQVTSAQVIAVIQAVPSVRGVELSAFYPTGARPELRQTIRARAARWDRAQQNILPAELLLYDPADGDLLLPLAGSA